MSQTSNHWDPRATSLGQGMPRLQLRPNRCDGESSGDRGQTVTKDSGKGGREDTGHVRSDARAHRGHSSLPGAQ